MEGPTRDEIKALVKLLQKGDPNAGPLLVALVAPILFGYARALAPDLSQTECELACEEALEKAVERIEQYDPSRGDFIPWVRTFVRHALGDARRSPGRAVPYEGVDAWADQAPPSPPEADEATLSAVDEAILELSATDQTIIFLRDYDRLTFAQCAARIGGVTAQACRVRHHRALLNLRRLLQERRTDDLKGDAD